MLAWLLIVFNKLHGTFQMLDPLSKILSPLRPFPERKVPECASQSLDMWFPSVLTPGVVAQLQFLQILLPVFAIMS